MRPLTILFLAGCAFVPPEGTGVEGGTSSGGSGEDAPLSSSTQGPGPTSGALETSWGPPPPPPPPPTSGPGRESFGEPPRTSGDPTAPTDSTSGSGESSTTASEPPYPPCPECPGRPCVSDGDADACAPFCDEGCPDPGFGLPQCLGDVTDEFTPQICIVACAPGECGDGMECRETGFHVDGNPLRACMWGPA